MKIKINHNNDDLWCLYYKEKIEIGEKYIEIEEEDSDGVYYKTYSYECLNMLVDEYLEANDVDDVEIQEEYE